MLTSTPYIIYNGIIYIGVWGKRVRLKTSPQTGNALQEERKETAKPAAWGVSDLISVLLLFLLLILLGRS